MEEKGKILIVDDEVEIVSILKHFLALKGYETIGAVNGEQTLDILSKQKIDLVLLDILMPGIKGTEIAKIIKEKYQSVKLIIISALSDEIERLEKDKLLDAYLVKPVNIQELHQKLSEVLSGGEHKDYNSKISQALGVRVLYVEARILFMEPSLEIYNFLNTHLHHLSQRGEYYHIECAENQEEVLEKARIFNPDILAVNAALFKNYNTSSFRKVFDKNMSLKEIIVYNISKLVSLKQEELGRLEKALKTACFKNGLVKVKEDSI